MAKALVEKVFAGKEVTILEEMPGESLRGMAYEPLYRFVELGQARLVRGVRQLRHHGRTARASCISPPPLARTTTGCARINGLPFVNLVDTQG